jgi:hypothetical protein
MANKKFSEFTLKTDQANVDALVGYTGTENIQIDPTKVGLRYDLLSGQGSGSPLNYEFRLEDNAGGGVDKVTLVPGDNIVLTNLSSVPNVGGVKIDTKRGSVYNINGTFQNLFGGDPGIFGDTCEFGISSIPAADNSSVLIVPQSAKLLSVTVKWISSSPVNIPLGATYKFVLRVMTSTSGATTDTSNYGVVQTFNNMDLTNSDNGTYPFKSEDVTLLNGGAGITIPANTIINFSGEVTQGTIPTSNGEMEVLFAFETNTF